MYFRLRLNRWIAPLFVLALIIAVHSGCDKSGPVEPEQDDAAESFSIHAASFPDFWVYGSTRYRPVTLELSLSEAMKEQILSGQQEAPAVLLAIEILDGPALFQTRLRDDGSMTTVSDSDFVASSSGDVVPGDYVYRLMLNANFAATEGSYLIQLHAGSTEEISSLPFVQSPAGVLTWSDTAVVSANSAPTLDALTSVLPDSLHSGFAQETWSVEITDPDQPAGDSVLAVDMALVDLPDDTLRTLILSRGGSDRWTLLADSSFAAGLTTGEYEFRFSAVDRFDERSASLDTTVWIENTAPALTDEDIPDTVYAPAGPESNYYSLLVKVQDLQSRADIQQVYYDVIDPTNVFFSHEDHPLWVLTDGGSYPDETAQDGTYTVEVEIQPTVSNFGTYQFIFYGEDKAGNVSLALNVPIVMVAE
jgi:hypothetical protein